MELGEGGDPLSPHAKLAKVVLSGLRALHVQMGNGALATVQHGTPKPYPFLEESHFGEPFGESCSTLLVYTGQASGDALLTVRLVHRGLCATGATVQRWLPQPTIKPSMVKQWMPSYPVAPFFQLFFWEGLPFKLNQPNKSNALLFPMATGHLWMW